MGLPGVEQIELQQPGIYIKTAGLSGQRQTAEYFYRTEG